MPLNKRKTPGCNVSPQQKHTDYSPNCYSASLYSLTQNNNRIDDFKLRYISCHARLAERREYPLIWNKKLIQIQEC